MQNSLTADGIFLKHFLCRIQNIIQKIVPLKINVNKSEKHSLKKQQQSVNWVRINLNYTESIHRQNDGFW